MTDIEIFWHPLNCGLFGSKKTIKLVSMVCIGRLGMETRVSMLEYHQNKAKMVNHK